MARSFFRTVLFFLLTAGFVLLIYRQYLLSNIPPGRKSIPVPLEKEEILLLRRPGTQSIRIVRPFLNTLKFQINIKRNPQPLDWKYLERTDNKADVKVVGTVDGEGNFIIERIQDKGHPVAGMYIRKVLSSWTFVHYKKGTIRYYFNVPTKNEHMKVLIDIRGLEMNEEYVEPSDLIVDGKLHYIKGLKRNNVMLVR